MNNLTLIQTYSIHPIYNVLTGHWFNEVIKISVLEGYIFFDENKNEYAHLEEIQLNLN